LTTEFGSSALSSLPSTILSRHGDSGKSGNHRGDGGQTQHHGFAWKIKEQLKLLKHLKFSFQKNIFYIYILFLQCCFLGATSAESASFFGGFLDLAIL